jgi:hypothetical protein
VDHSRPRLRPVYGSSLAFAFLTGEVPLTAATALLATPKRGEGGCRPAAKRAHQSVSTRPVEVVVFGSCLRLSILVLRFARYVGRMRPISS